MNAKTRTLILFGAAILLLSKRAKAAPLSLAQLRALAVSVGFPEPDKAAAIAMAESGGDPSAVGDLALGGSYGLWQINARAHPEFAPASLVSPEFNARAALTISQKGADWTPWSVFNNGLYLRFMPKGST